MNRGLLIGSVVVAGDALGVVLAWQMSDLAAIAIAGASIAIAAGHGRLRSIAVLTTLAALAAADGAAARARVLASPLAAWFEGQEVDERAGALVDLDGVLASDAAVTDSGVNLTIRVERLIAATGDRRDMPVAIRGTVQAHVTGALGPSRAAEWTAGRHIRAPIALRRPQMFLNPGGASETWQRIRRPFDLVGTIKSGALVEIGQLYLYVLQASDCAHRDVSAGVQGQFG